MGIIREALDKLEKFVEAEDLQTIITDIKSLNPRIIVKKYKRAKNTKIRVVCLGTGFGVDTEFTRENALIKKGEELAEKHNIKLEIKNDPNYGVLWLDFIV